MGIAIRSTVSHGSHPVDTTSTDDIESLAIWQIIRIRPAPSLKMSSGLLWGRFGRNSAQPSASWITRRWVRHACPFLASGVHDVRARTRSCLVVMTFSRMCSIRSLMGASEHRLMACAIKGFALSDANHGGEVTGGVWPGWRPSHD